MPPPTRVPPRDAAHAEAQELAIWLFIRIMDPTLERRDCFELPDDVIGEDVGFDEAGLEKRVKKIRFYLHPDRHATEREKWEEASKRISQLYDKLTRPTRRRSERGSEPQPEAQPEPEPELTGPPRELTARELSFDIQRGADGLFGVDIIGSPRHNIYHVVAGILPGSAAAEAGLFQLGDVVSAVNGTPTLPGVPIPDLLAKLPPSDHYRFDVLRAGLTNRAHRAAREAYTNAGIEPPVGAAGTADSRPSAHSNGNCRRRQHDSALLMLGPDTPRDVIFAQAAAVQQAHDTDGPSGTIVVSRRRVMVRKRIA